MAPSKHKHPLHCFNIPEAEWQALKARAAEEGRPVAEVLRGLVRDYLK